jgi:hypothetical protein
VGVPIPGMSPSLRPALVGPSAPTRTWRYELLAVATGTLCSVFAAYAVGLFAVSGGVVLLAGQATLVGLACAAGLGAFGRGALYAWVAVYAALLGEVMDHYLLGLSGRSLGARVGALLEPDGLTVLLVAALVLGTLSWGLGRLGARAVAAVRRERSAGTVG